jgi:F0F1-type ATP synthase assembly protein I
MTDVSNQDKKRRQRLILVGQLAAMLAGIAAVFLTVTTFLSFVASECEVGTPFLPEVFVCFPPP